MRAAIFGASGGIGAALVQQLADSPDCAAVYAGSRKVPAWDDPKITPFAFDLTDEASIAGAAELIGGNGPLGLVIIATGLLHREGEVGPEKSSRMIDPQTMAEVFAINTIGPALIAKHFLPLLLRDRRAVFAALSARVGSISDNRLGGWHSYRASKAALNMLMRNFALELAVRNPDAIAVTLHPGTVDTGLSKPFQRQVRAGQLFTPAASASHLLSVIASLAPKDSGLAFAWDGAVIPF